MKNEEEKCAQRLTASHIESPDRIAESGSGTTSAQRLTASHIESLPAHGAVVVDSGDVLNALRHLI